MTTATAVRRRPRGGPAYNELARQLDDMARRGEYPACTQADQRDLWTSERERDRDAAVIMCRGCPVLKACKAAGRSERYYVWGGKDRTRRARAETIT
jgi:Transcription factor WhiB